MKIILGTKIGMTQIIGEDGVVTPVTILQAGPCTVTQTKTVESDGYSAVQLAFGQGKNLSKAVSGHVEKSGEDIKPKLFGFHYHINSGNIACAVAGVIGNDNACKAV